MGLSNARRALVVDNNPWNRRQICDVLAKKGYEVSACDSLSEGKKFYRAHPIVVAGEGGDEGELAEFFEYVRGSASEIGGYVIRLSAGEADGGCAADDVIGPDLNSDVLEEKFTKADQWLSQRVSAAESDTEIITSGSGGADEFFKTQTKQDVKTDSDPKTANEIEAAASAVMEPGSDGVNNAVSIWRGSGRKRSESADEKSTSGAMPEKTTKYEYNLLIENAPLAMAMFDTDMGYLIANGRWRSHFDLEGTEVIGRGHLEIFSEVSEPWQRLCDRARDEKREVVDEEFVQWPDGSTDWVRWTMSPWQNASGEQAGLVVSCGVITDEKRKGSDQQFESGLAESLMSSGVTPLVVLDFSGRVVRCNRIAKRWGDWGLTSGDDRLFWDAFVPSGERQVVRESFNSYASEMVEEGEFKFPPVSVEAVRGEGGEERLVAWTNTPRVGDDGVITGLVRVGVEIRSEDMPHLEPVDPGMDEEAVSELQDEWMDSFPLMCWRTNSRGKIKFFNRQWLDFRGRNALEECDNGWMDGLHEEDYDSLIHAFDTAAKTGARVNHVARVLGGDGQYSWLRFVSARDFSDLEGASDGFIGYCEDLARTIRLENELSAARSRYDELLEDSTGTFRAKREMKEKIDGLESQLEDEKKQLTEEREAAVAKISEELASSEKQREEAVAKLASEKSRLEQEHGEALEALKSEKESALQAVVLEKNEALEKVASEKEQALSEAREKQRAELAAAIEEKQALLEEREGSLKKALAEAESKLEEASKRAEEELGATRDRARREVESLRSEMAERVSELEKDRDTKVEKHAMGIAALRADFDSAAAEKTRLAGEVAAEKERQKARDAELVRLRKDVDKAQSEMSAAITDRDRFVTIPESAPFGMILVERDGSMVYSNPAADEVAGVKFANYDTVEAWLSAKAPVEEDGDRERLLELWRDRIWRKEGTKVISMQTSGGLRELELKSKLLPEGKMLLSMFDVTDAQRAEEALRASEVKFRSIFYDSGVGMALVDRTGNIFDANPAQEKLMGYSRSELRKMHIEDCMSIEEITRTQELSKEMAEKRSRSGELTLKLLPKDKRPCWAHMNVSLVRDPDGEVIFAAYFFHDITKERNAISKEQLATSSLESSQAERQAIVEASPDLIVVVAPDGTVENIVPPVRFPLHIDDAMEGRLIGEVIPPIADSFAALAAESKSTGGVGKKEFSVVQSDETLHFECRIAPSGQENVVVVIRDITAAKKAEEAMRRQALTFANIRDAIVVADLKGRINDWNPAAEEMFGYSREEAIGKGLYVIYDREEPKRFKQTISSSIGNHRKWEARTKFHHKDGTEGECEVCYTPLLNEAGKPVALVGVSRYPDPVVEVPAAPAAPVPAVAVPQAGVEDRIRQSVQSLADILAVQEEAHASNEDVRGELATSRSRVESIQMLHDAIAEGGDFANVDFGQYVRKLVQKLLAEFGPQHAAIEVHLNVKGINLPADVAQPLGIIVFELLSNSLRHAFEKRSAGMVGVSMGIGPDSGWLVVNDDGVGLPKGLNLAAPTHGTGLKIAARQAAQVGGKLKLEDAMDTEIQVGFRLNGAT